jgi:3-phenylpropionate/trans-cinnamate dioxygenase ferredoxin subunit
MTNIGKFSEFESGVAKKVKVDGVAVAVVRIDDEIFAIADKCSHADVSLSDCCFA